jgi:two-component system NarL family sensor kinase
MDKSQLQADIDLSEELQSARPIDETDSLRRSEANLATCIFLLEVKDAEIAKLLLEVAELKAQSQQKEDFVVSLAHDLKSPLLGAVRVLELLSTGAVPAAAQGEILRVALRSHHAMLIMIRNMIDVYKSESGALLPLMEPTNVSVLLSETLEEFAALINDKELTINKSINDVPAALADSILLRRVVMNLIDNAVKFSPQGSALSLSLSQEGRQIVIAIKDSGNGLSESQVAQIFNRFWQSDSGRRCGIGSGLGLYSSKQIVESMQGSIECRSEENSGAEFKVLLNVA